ncbi:hypothetical protein HZH68_004300 [Vespula germanica]|uniref:Uncharacterized protein n=1 Tax=Vespula germanica TaxID=30212 RepID=A0A834KRK3_VESGE|nr:hypothetical protein HZH68_004300 [Vespula germanica]
MTSFPGVSSSTFVTGYSSFTRTINFGSMEVRETRGWPSYEQTTLETPARRYESCKAVNATTPERARLQPHGAFHMKPQES